MSRTITTCAGIGDSLWVIMKLINSGERFHWLLPDGSPQRGKQIFDLMPQVTFSCKYEPGLSYAIVKENSEPAGSWKAIKKKRFFLEANTHLEAGLHIEEFLPDLPTTYRLEYNTSANDITEAEKILYFSQAKKEDIQLDFERSRDDFLNNTFTLGITIPMPTTKYIGIYASAYRNNNRHWNMWRESEWVPFIQMMHKEIPGTCFVVIGAEYDADHSNNIMNSLKQLKIPYVNTVGQPLSVVVEILKRLSYFVGFPSGLSILNETLGKDGAMFYPKHLIPMMNAWADPERIKSGSYKALQLCSPERLWLWLRDEYKIKDKI